MTGEESHESQVTGKKGHDHGGHRGRPVANAGRVAEVGAVFLRLQPVANYRGTEARSLRLLMTRDP